MEIPLDRDAATPLWPWLLLAAASAAFEPHLLWHKLGYPREAAHAGH